MTDIEGTTTPIRFVHDVLFPYARARLPALVAAPPDDETAAAIARIPPLAPPGARTPLEALEAWQDADSKIEPLKTLQGIAWRQGYATGELKADLYPDVPPALRCWHAAGLRLAVYSSGSVEAQRLIFGHTAWGDLAPLFAGFFDTRIGAKREAASYAAIADALELGPAAILFLSDVGAELDAARAAGLPTCQLLRPADGAVRAEAHPGAPDFDAVADAFGLPRSCENSGRGLIAPP